MISIFQRSWPTGSRRYNSTLDASNQTKGEKKFKLTGAEGAIDERQIGKQSDLVPAYKRINGARKKLPVSSTELPSA